MAESFTVPGQSCDVGTLIKKYGCGDLDGCSQAWKDFCDCMFTSPGTTTQWFADGVLVPNVQGVGLSAEALATELGKQGKKITAQVTASVIRSADWRKCVAGPCLDPTGCRNSNAGDNDGFNIDPQMGMPPWTDAGAAARGIPKRNAGLWYTFSGVIAVHPEDYTPLALWHAFWENKLKFAFLVAKAGVFAVFFPPAGLLLSMVATPINLVIAANAQCIAEGKDWLKEILLPIGKGTVKDMGMALALLGSGGPVNPIVVAGVLVQRAAQDQIDDGTITHWDPITQSVVLFLAKNGQELGQRLQSLGGKTLKDAPELLGFLESGLLLIAADPNITDASVKAALQLTATLFKLLRVIMESSRAGLDVLGIADKVCNELFGVHFTQVIAAGKQGKAAVEKLVTDAKSVGGIGNLQTGLNILDSIGKSMSAVSNFIDEVIRLIGDITTGLGKLRDQFNLAAQAFDAARLTTANTVHDAVAGTPIAGAAVPAGTVIGGGLAITDNSAGTGKLGFAIAGAIGGALVGGPGGAAVGGVVGALLGGAPQASTTPGSPGFNVSAGKATVVRLGPNAVATTSTPIAAQTVTGGAVAHAKAALQLGGWGRGFGAFGRASAPLMTDSLPVAVAKDPLAIRPRAVPVTAPPPEPTGPLKLPPSVIVIPAQQETAGDTTKKNQSTSSGEKPMDIINTSVIPATKNYTAPATTIAPPTFTFLPLTTTGGAPSAGSMVSTMAAGGAAQTIGPSLETSGGAPSVTAATTTAIGRTAGEIPIVTSAGPGSISPVGQGGQMETPPCAHLCPPGQVLLPDCSCFDPKSISEAIPPGMRAQVSGMSTGAKIALGLGALWLLRKIL